MLLDDYLSMRGYKLFNNHGELKVPKFESVLLFFCAINIMNYSF